MRRKFFIFTLGCQMNESDSERLASYLQNLGLRETNSEKSADIIIVNACSVRQKAIDRIFGKLKNWQKLKKDKPELKFILTGCVLPKDKEKLENKFDLIFEIGGFEKLRKFIKQFQPPLNLPLAKGEGVGVEACSDYFKIIPKYKRKDQALVPIMTGCNNFCSYCAVPYTRGREKSRKMEDILHEVKQLIEKGYKKIVLLGQNVNSYQFPISNFQFPIKSQILNTKYKIIDTKKSDFVVLLEKINNIPGEFEIEFMTSHPKDMKDELILAFIKLPKLTPKIHLALQSGDNAILRRMNRKYTRTQFRDLVAKIRKMIPWIELSTDVIVGYPSETKKQFLNTVSLCKEMEFKKAYIAVYSPRPGTEAVKLKDNVSYKEKKRRWRVLDLLINKKMESKIQDARYKIANKIQ